MVHMDVQTIISAIGSLGFPIICCVIMFKQLQEDRENNNAQREADRLEHKREMENITSALQNNTIVMQKLVDTLSYPEQGQHTQAS